MPETEPTPWELMRVMRSMDTKLDQVVTKDMFQAESRRVDERLDEQGRDIADERTARAEAIAAERGSRKEETSAIRASQAAFEAKVDADHEKEKAGRRWLWASVLIPVSLYLIDFLRTVTA